MTNEEFIQSIALPGEEWRVAVGLNGDYIVSSFGRMASLPRVIMRGGRPYKKRGTLMKPRLNKHGYYVVFCRKDGKYVFCPIHRVVAKAFIPNPYNKPVVDHIDTNRTNNNVLNLRWCTLSENNLNPITQKKMIQNAPLLEKRPIVAIGIDGHIEHFESYSDAARAGYKMGCFRRCLNGTQRLYKGKQWMHLSDYESQVSMSKNSNADL